MKKEKTEAKKSFLKRPVKAPSFAGVQKFLTSGVKVKIPQDGASSLLTEHETRGNFKPMNTQENIARWR